MLVKHFEFGEKGACVCVVGKILEKRRRQHIFRERMKKERRIVSEWHAWYEKSLVVCINRTALYFVGRARDRFLSILNKVMREL